MGGAIGRRPVIARARRSANGPWLERLARAGYATKGVLYATVGVLALQLASGHGGKATGQRGAIEHLQHVAPGFATVLLVLLAVGLAGLGLWRLVQALFDPEHDGSGAKGVAKRIGRGIAGLLYGGLCASVIRTVAGLGRVSGQSEGPRARAWTARLMDLPLGQALVATVGVVVVGYGVLEVVKGLRRTFEKQLRLDGIAAMHAERIRRISTFGLVARGFVFAVMGGFLVSAAVRHDPSQTRGLGETLGALASQPAGGLLLALVAVGLVAYAAYSFVQARYRRFPSERRARA